MTYPRAPSPQLTVTLSLRDPRRICAPTRSARVGPAKAAQGEGDRRPAIWQPQTNEVRGVEFVGKARRRRRRREHATGSPAAVKPRATPGKPARTCDDRPKISPSTRGANGRLTATLCKPEQRHEDTRCPSYLKRNADGQARQSGYPQFEEAGCSGPGLVRRGQQPSPDLAPERPAPTSRRSGPGPTVSSRQASENAVVRINDFGVARGISESRVADAGMINAFESEVRDTTKAVVGSTASAFEGAYPVGPGIGDW